MVRIKTNPTSTPHLDDERHDSWTRAFQVCADPKLPHDLRRTLASDILDERPDLVEVEREGSRFVTQANELRSLGDSIVTLPPEVTIKRILEILRDLPEELRSNSRRTLADTKSRKDIVIKLSSLEEQLRRGDGSKAREKALRKLLGEA